MTSLLEVPQGLILKSGSHKSFDDGCCVMEAVSYIAGEPWSHRPACACPVITSFLVSWNDNLPNDESRTRLLTPIIPLVVGTRNKELELPRVMMTVDWMLREFLPTWLELTPALAPSAAELRAFKPIQSWEEFDLLIPVVVRAKNQAAAAWDAARDAARAAARQEFAALVEESLQ